MNKILEICTTMISITETLMHSHWQLTTSRYLSMKDKKELADDLQENVSDQLRECLHEIGELLQTCKTVFPFEEDDYDDYDGDDEDEDEEDEDADEGFDFGDPETTIYEVECVCGQIVDFDEETLEEGSIVCPNCGETLEFSLEEDEDEE